MELLYIAAVYDVVAERHRQRKREGFDDVRDDAYVGEELAAAACCYALPAAEHSMRTNFPPRFWPWVRSWWKPTTRRRNLVKAAALLIAEIERLDRKEACDGRK